MTPDMSQADDSDKCIRLMTLVNDPVEDCPEDSASLASDSVGASFECL